PGLAVEEVGVFACATEPLESESFIVPISSAETATRPPASPPISTARRLPPAAEPERPGAVVGWAAVSGWATLRGGGGNGGSCRVGWRTGADGRTARVAASASPPCLRV